MTTLPGFADLLCVTQDCLAPADRRGLCNRHYTRWSRDPERALAEGIAPLPPRRKDGEVDRPADALTAAIERLPSVECVPWTGSRTPGGYGIVGHGPDRNRNAHRVIYERVVGPLEQNMQLDHLCHTADLGCSGGTSCLHRACVNPAHLEPVTASQNRQRGVQSRPGACPKGHPFTPENTGRKKPNAHHPNGARYCRACAQARDERRRAAK